MISSGNIWHINYLMQTSFSNCLQESDGTQFVPIGGSDGSLNFHKIYLTLFIIKSYINATIEIFGNYVIRMNCHLGNQVVFVLFDFIFDKGNDTNV